MRANFWKCLSSSLLVFGLGAGIPVRAALLDGQTVATTNYHGIAPDMSTYIGPVDRVAGPGIELTSFGWQQFVSVDFTDTNILITLRVNQPFGYFEVLRFADAHGTIPEFTGVAVNPVTDYAGFGPSRISFYSDVIDVNLTALHGLQGQRISLDIAGASPAALPGDCNCDGRVDFADIVPFVDALHGAAPCQFANCDVNGDGTLDFADIDPFVALLGR